MSGEQRPHALMDKLVELNQAIEVQLNTLDGSHHVHNQLISPLAQFSELALPFLHNDDLHRVRHNIVASLSSVLFITECRLRLLLNDADWCDLDSHFRSKSQFFSRELLFQQALYTQQNVPFYNTHPLVQYKMSQCHQTLCALLRSKYVYKTQDSIVFVETLYNAVRDRVSILANYPYSLESNDMIQYVVRIGHERAVCTSAFIYDFMILCRECQRRLLLFRTCVSRYLEAPYALFLTESRPRLTHWVGQMTITAAGDDFCDLFSKFYLAHHIQPFELMLYKRLFPQNSQIISYKVLQHIRGPELANAFMASGNEFISNLLKKDTLNTNDDQVVEVDEADDSMCTVPQILERMALLSPIELDLLFKAVIDYVLIRQWDRTIDSFMAYDFNDNVADEPRILWVPLRRTYVVLSITMEDMFFERFIDAFSVLAYHIQRHYNATLFNPATHERVSCSTLFRNILGSAVSSELVP